MPATIICTRLPAGPTQRTDLEKLFGSPAFLFLKEMVASRCIAAQAAALNAMIYPDNEVAVAKFETEKKNAADFNKVLDILDDFQKKEDEWFTVTLERANS